MSNTLWTKPYQTSGRIIRAVAAWGGVPIEVPTYVHMTDNKQAEFLDRFPYGKVPAFEGADGLKLFEGAVIARYITELAPNSGLLGTDLKESTLIHQWAHFGELEIESCTRLIAALVDGTITPYNKPIHTQFAEFQLRAIKAIEEHLSTRTFLVGERITLADITVALYVLHAATVSFDAPLRAKYPHVIRHLETVINQPRLKDVLEHVEPVEKAVQYVPPQKEKKEKEPKAAPAPKVEKKKPKPTEEEDEDDAPPPPKVHNPLDDLPKSTFNLEDWKRAYSNKETRGPDGALEWFYQNFDKEGFSLWRFDFKYNEELTLTFMSANQISGFYNRLEASRKYLFGSAGVLGEANNSIIAGALILRGQDFKPVMDVAPDWESYTYSRLNLEDEKDKAFFEAALAWDLEINGKKWVDGKNFK